MDYLDLGPDGVAGTSDDQWLPAVEGNFGSTNNTFVGVEPWNGDMTLGEWGVNVETHSVWAVVDHNSDFAVVPDPARWPSSALDRSALLLMRCISRRTTVSIGKSLTDPAMV